MIRQHIEALGGNEVRMNGGVHDSNNFEPVFGRNQPSGGGRKGKGDAFVEDLEDSMPGAIPTISNQVSNHVAMANGGMNGKLERKREPASNGHVPNGRLDFRSMLDDAELDSHI